MKTENMKLLDLQTGKYLELGTGFSYSGEWIILITFARLHNRVADAYWIEANSTNITNARYLKTEPQEPLKTLCKKTGAVVYGGRYVLVNEITYKNLYGIDGNVKDYSGKWTDEEINKCIERTFRSGDIITVEYVTYSPNDSRREHGNFSTYNIIFRDEHSFQYGETPKLSGLDCGNPFEEYSKQLRNEPNKFEELKQYFK